MRVLGIDPGLRLTGYGCVTGQPGRPELIEAGVFRLVSKGPLRSVSARLEELSRDLGAVLDRLEPQAVAVEGLFTHYRHPTTAVVMAHARGVVLLEIETRGLDLIELKPAAVKKSITGSGRADKAQMQRAIQSLFSLPEPPEPPDVADALAIAVCGAERLATGVEAIRATTKP
jgi:crossover junction endodeoxyribonuclease RuvC